jgi:hypothetical protein
MLETLDKLLHILFDVGVAVNGDIRIDKLEDLIDLNEIYLFLQLKSANFCGVIRMNLAILLPEEY